MKINFLLIIVFVSIIIYANIDYEHGIVGHTKRDGDPGCLCHSITPTNSVIVWIKGPDTIFTNDSAYYKILMTLEDFK